MTLEDFSQPDDFRDESEALHAVLASRPDSDLALTTQFKAWSIEDVIAHLHLFNQAADLSLRDPAGLTELFVSMNWRPGTPGAIGSPSSSRARIPVSVFPGLGPI